MNAFSRRHFLQAAVASSVAVTQIPAVIRGVENEKKLKMGIIGCGWYGMVDAKAALQAGGVEVVALCDVDSAHLEQSAGELEKLQGKRPKTFKHHADFLKVPELEAVVIATPPHWHALQLIASLERGVDVYCEKPLSYDVREGRAMVDAVKKSGRIVQVGFQRRQNAAMHAVRQRIRSGDSGKIVCAEANIHYTAGTKDPTPQDPPPLRSTGIYGADRGRRFHIAPRWAI
jgi:predicted dehydrogenase